MDIVRKNGTIVPASCSSSLSTAPGSDLAPESDLVIEALAKHGPCCVGHFEVCTCMLASGYFCSKMEKQPGIEVYLDAGLAQVGTLQRPV